MNAMKNAGKFVMWHRVEITLVAGSLAVIGSIAYATRLVADMRNVMRRRGEMLRVLTEDPEVMKTEAYRKLMRN